MFKTFGTLVLLTVMTTAALAQEPAAAPSQPPVVLLPASYTELEKISVELDEAKEDEAAALANYQAKVAMRIVVEQAIQVSVLKALMALGITDPTRKIAAPPKPEAPERP